MKFPRSAKIFRGQMEAAPYAGVLFLLALFLLLQSSLVFTPGVRIRLPAAEDLPGVSGPTVAVSVDPTGQLYYENQAIKAESLEAQLKKVVQESKGNLTLIIQADESVNYKILVHLSTLARDIGIHEVLLAARPRVFSTPGQP